MSKSKGPASSQNTPVRRSWADVGPRLVSALVLIALTVVSLYLGGIWFALVVSAVFAGCYREWETMVSRQPITPRGIAIVALVALSGVVFPFFGFVWSLAAVAIACCVALTMGRGEILWRIVGIVLFSALIISALLMRGVGDLGIVAGVFLGTCVWMTDSAAFFTGRQIGGEKLAPAISPSKTWSGALGGLALGTIAGLAVWMVLTPSPWWIGLIVAASISVLGQVGDLTESSIKRWFRIKDTGDIIPGHGGLMDRLDSLTFGLFLVVIIGATHQGFGSVAEGLLHW
ncbi:MULTISPECIES: phosphatidate cytidylyltransferase [unclassified Devosia]|uniref:phosphatidate cytidylyltransferase n=1 Tax=unclassified Devosia TaxID=196773 RepID=UPI00145DACFB|nr:MULTISPECIES: phosphatidate cytidylyltransferase [unclassified Devosia]MBJ6986342.1 phosphatidate cytidylyltransferase [Devosia sp. MC521]QMW64179.1 phosphatidate cytidylyltransferase [Devosia sp. MC521]